jgi:hypothetical protein
VVAIHTSRSAQILKLPVGTQQFRVHHAILDNAADSIRLASGRIHALFGAYRPTYANENTKALLIALSRETRRMVRGFSLVTPHHQLLKRLGTGGAEKQAVYVAE